VISDSGLPKISALHDSLYQHGHLLQVASTNMSIPVPLGALLKDRGQTSAYLPSCHNKCLSTPANFESNLSVINPHSASQPQYIHLQIRTNIQPPSHFSAKSLASNLATKKFGSRHGIASSPAREHYWGPPRAQETLRDDS
jgi:hypothetical protein